MNEKLGKGAESAAAAGLTDVRLENIRFCARDINLYEFKRLDGQAAAAFTAGAHIDIHLPNGAVRQYSLLDLDRDPASYVIGVKYDPKGRGGSKYMHETLRVGTELKISVPRNNFPLIEEAKHSVLIAGGIGITPIFTMLKRLSALGRSVEVHYSSRSRADAAFLDTLQSLQNVTLNFDDENAGKFIDMTAIVARSNKETHFYCCGPAPMLKAFEAATESLAPEQVHVEYFAPQGEKSTEGGFVVELARSGKTIEVQPGQTILAAVLAAGVDAPYSCEEGVCGACMTDVIEGIPDHLDSVMTPAERTENKKIMICCSGSKSARLVLDL